jgi:hypothetical protein
LLDLELRVFSLVLFLQVFCLSSFVFFPLVSLLSNVNPRREPAIQDFCSFEVFSLFGKNENKTFSLYFFCCLLRIANSQFFIIFPCFYLFFVSFCFFFYVFSDIFFFLITELLFDFELSKNGRKCLTTIFLTKLWYWTTQNLTSSIWHLFNWNLFSCSWKTWNRTN